MKSDFKPEDIDVYVFDLYGTLINVRTDERADKTWKKWIKCLDGKGIKHPALMQFRKDFFDTDKRYREEAKAKGIYEYPEPDVIDMYREMFEKYGNGVISDEILEKVSYAFRVASREYIRLFPGVKEYLTEIRNQGKHAYLLSNAQASYTRPEIDMFRLGELLDDMLLSSECEVMKPDKQFFDMLIDKHKINKERAIMFGDSLENDVMGAKEAGLHYVHLAGEYTPRAFYVNKTFLK